MFYLRPLLQDKNPGMLGAGVFNASTRDRRIDREVNTMCSMTRPFLDMAGDADEKRVFTFKKRVGLTSPQSLSLLKKFDTLVAGDAYPKSDAVSLSVDTRTHLGVFANPIARTYSITLQARQSELARIAYRDFGITSHDFQKTCPSYVELDKKKATYTLSLALEPYEADELKSKIKQILESVRDVHTLSVNFMPSRWYTSVWLAATKQKELRVKFEGKSINIKAVLHAIGLKNNAIRQFTHEYDIAR